MQISDKRLSSQQELAIRIYCDGGGGGGRGLGGGVLIKLKFKFRTSKKRWSSILDFNLSPCSECNMFSFG